MGLHRQVASLWRAGLLASRDGYPKLRWVAAQFEETRRDEAATQPFEPFGAETTTLFHDRDETGTVYWSVQGEDPRNRRS